MNTVLMSMPSDVILYDGLAECSYCPFHGETFFCILYVIVLFICCSFDKLFRIGMMM